MFRNILHENYPPWQIILVPLTPNQYYIIVRLHHLYISEDKLGLSDLIMMNEDHNQWIMADENIGNTKYFRYLSMNSTTTGSMWNVYVILLLNPIKMEEQYLNKNRKKPIVE